MIVIIIVNRGIPLLQDPETFAIGIAGGGAEDSQIGIFLERGLPRVKGTSLRDLILQKALHPRHMAPLVGDHRPQGHADLLIRDLTAEAPGVVSLDDNRLLCLHVTLSSPLTTGCKEDLFPRDKSTALLLNTYPSMQSLLILQGHLRIDDRASIPLVTIQITLERRLLAYARRFALAVVLLHGIIRIIALI